jgi:hypothetical protein
MGDRVPFEAMRGHGQSFENTVDKERAIWSAISISLQVGSARKLRDRGFTFWFLDANAGSGHNDFANVPGSPVVFHLAADRWLRGLRRCAFLCDINRDAITHLSDRLGAWSSSSILLPYDNEEVLEVFAERIRSCENPRFAVGCIIADPNGYWYRNARGEGPPIKGLVKFASEFPRIDIVLNLNARAYRLQRGQGHGVLPPLEVLASLKKKYWLVRYTKHRGDHWLLAVGRNFETDPHSSLGFHRLDSEAGRAIMMLVEGGRQGDLAV